ncbi:hypothetical protein Vadar_010806 [Vaccinium darrowii]|uniref:Uncharacterized protein n=1 Tax=Vaccinium darrowii TaxID=229202 RepID=A0ACB7XQS9_9ERIC|nr:hypothetical protein Vadar_010806 [Vaccinium darrowii]
MESLFNGGELSWILSWLDGAVKWSPDLLDTSNRFVWISCYGVPIHGWCCATFRIIAQRWGEIVSIEEATAQGLSFAVGKVLISTNVWDRNNEEVHLVIEGNVYVVKVVEEQLGVQGHCSCCGIKPSKSDELSNSMDDSVEDSNSNRGEGPKVDPIVSPHAEESLPPVTLSAAAVVSGVNSKDCNPDEFNANNKLVTENSAKLARNPRIGLTFIDLGTITIEKESYSR